MIAILGGGESGVGAALLAKKRGFDVFVSDYGIIENNYKEELEKAGVDFEEGQHNFDKLKFCSLVVKSPGISSKTEIVKALKNHGISIVSEIEWAFRFCEGKIIAITGTNGKTTTTGLCEHILNHAGLNAVAVGNIGYSFSRAVAFKSGDYWVCECSSFQLEDLDTFRPEYAVVLNVTPDHLDRYESLDDYASAKWNIISQMQSEDVCLIPRKEIPGQPDVDNIKLVDYCYDGESIEVQGESFGLKNSYLQGPHNAENASVCIELALRIGIEKEIIDEALDTFVNEAHRLELVGETKGKRYINDSKATNLDSTEMALRSFEGEIIWIVGGVDKGNDYDSISDLIKTKVISVIGLGKDLTKIRNMAAKLQIDIFETQSMEEAVRYATTFEKDGVVLLSPACASFDLYKNYKERGDRFREEVQKILNE